MKNKYTLMLVCLMSIGISAMSLDVPSSLEQNNSKKINSALPSNGNLVAFTVDLQDGRDLIKWTAPSDPFLTGFEIERSTDGNGNTFFNVGNVNPQSSDIGSLYEFYSPGILNGVRYYRLKINYKDGSYEYSDVVKVEDAINKRIAVSYTGTKQLQLSLPYNLKQMDIVNGEGRIVRRYTNLPAGSQLIDLGGLQSGIYWLHCTGNKMENIEVMNP